MKQTKIQSVFAVLFNFKPVKIYLWHCLRAYINLTNFLGARCTAQPAGQLYQLLQGCISILPPLSRSKKQWSVVHNSALFLIQEVPNLNLICVLKNMCPKEHFCLLQQIIFFLNFFC